MPAARALAPLAVGGAAASWGLWSVFLRPAGLPSPTAGTIMFVVMGLVLLPAARRDRPAAWSRRVVALLAANAVFDALNVLAFFAAMERITVAIAVLTHYLAPVLIALLAPYVDRQRVRGAVPAALVAVGGLTLLLEPWRGGGAPLGAALGAGSALMYCGNVFVVRRLGAAIGTARAISYHSFGGAALMLPFALATGGEPTLAGVAWVTIGAITIGALSGAAFVWGLGVIGSARAAMLTYLEPLVAVAVGALVWGEPLGRFAIAGGVLVLAGGAYAGGAGSRKT